MTSILIIEDDIQISRLINSTLTVEGYHCESALDGQEELHSCTILRFPIGVNRIREPV